MAIFGRSFPSKSHPFGAISAPTPTTDVTDTLTNTGVASYTLTSAEAQAVSQSGNATQALAVEGTKDTLTGTIIPPAEARDQFNRADGGLGANWTSPIATSHTGTPSISSNVVIGTSGVYSSAYWNGQTYTDALSEALIPTGSTSFDTVRLYTRLQNPNTGSVHAWMIEFNTAGIGIWRNYNSVSTNVATFSPIPQAGWRVGARVTNIDANQVKVEALYDTGNGVWNVAGSYTEDTTASGRPELHNAGYSGWALWGNAATTRSVDNFVVTPLTASGNAQNSQNLALDATFDTENNSAAGSQTITLERTAESDTNSGNATQALSVEATREPNKDNQGTGTQSLALDATAETDSTSEAGSQIITNVTGDTPGNSGSGSSTTSEATAETTANSATASQSLSESIVTPSIEDTLTNTGTASQSIVEKIAESPLGSEIRYSKQAVSDAFDRPNNSDLGADWLPIIGSFFVESLSTKVTDYGSDAVEIFTGTSFDSNQYSECLVYLLHSAGYPDAGVGPVVRGSTSSVTYYCLLVTANPSYGWVLKKFVSGTETILASAATSGAYPFADLDVVRLEVEGNTLRGYRNGTLFVTVNDSSIANGRPGIAFNEFAADERIDNWAGGSLVAGTDGSSTYKFSNADWDGSGWLQDNARNWPPVGTDWHALDSSAALYAAHGITGPSGYSYANNIFLRWDTSGLTNTNITGATLRVYAVGSGNPGGSTLLYGDYYDFGGAPSVLADYKFFTPSDSSIFTPIGPVTGANFPAYFWKNIPLTDLSGINKDGITGIRLGITSDTPTNGTDYALQIQSADAGAWSAAELIIEYQSVGNAQNIPTINTYDAEIVSNVGGPDYYGGGNYGEDEYGYPAQTIAESVAETVSNSATATIAIDESITTGAPTDTLTSTGTATLRINEADAQSPSQGGTGSQNLSEATAESLTNVGGTPYGTGNYGDNTYGIENQNITEKIAETDSNTGAATILISDFQTEAEVNTGTGAPTIAEATAETISNSATSTQTFTESIGTPSEGLDNVGTATLRITETEAGSESGSGSGSQNLSEKIAETDSNTGTGTQTFTEAIAEGANNTGTGSQNITEQSPEINLTSVALSTQTLVEKITETLSNAATSTQTFGEGSADSLNNSATNSQTLADLEADNPTNTGTGTHTSGEAISETDVVTFLASQSMDEQRDIVVVPFSDISTGTWTVAPLYEKVDELIVASGYPTETIRSGNNPSNDTAVMGLTPVSDPGIDNNHFINIEFYKDGTETLDLIVKLKEGNSVIATRTFTDVQETAGLPRRERIALSSGEASAIVDYSNLNVELIANQTS